LLQDSGAEVVLGGGGRSLELLSLEFPELERVDIPGYEIKYPAEGGMILNMLLSIPRILEGIRNEHKAVERIVKEKQIDLLISDNRYGLYSETVPSVFITHQVFIQTPFGQKTLHRMTRDYMNRFSECWIPDVSGSGNLSGHLSHLSAPPNHSHFIGPLSRFSNLLQEPSKGYELVFLLSGPEPQRSSFEASLLRQLQGRNEKMLLLRGIPGIEETKEVGALTIRSHMGSDALGRILSNAELLISRSGYSSLMDAAVLGKRCVFIPTPGQTEQEYLGQYHAEKGHCVLQKQSEMNIGEAIRQAASIRGFEKTSYSGELLRERIAYWMSR